MKTIEKIYDVTTGETVIEERDMTADELQKHKKLEEENAALAKLEAEYLEKRKIVEDKLAALGLTVDDLKVLGLG